LLKPITLKRFLAAMQKIDGYFSSHDVNDKSIHSAGKEYFFVKSGKELRKILLEDIQYFEGEKEYVRLVTTTGQLLIYRRLKDIDEQLASPFARVHNSYIVNTKQLNKIQDNHIFIAGKQIPISEKFKDRFMAVIQLRIF
jgi:DNA-binding LytR/AlgR family response regulator